MKNSTSQTFIEPIFRGARFSCKKPEFPTQAFSEIIAYEAIIRAIAKELYFSSNKERTRLPKGFQEYFKLSLTDLKLGSAIPVLSREYDDEKRIDDEFDSARDLLNEFLLSINDPKPFDKFPRKVIPLFDDLGKTLQPDESIELRVPGKSISPTYSKEIRSKILSISKKPYFDVCSLVGSISGFDAEKRKLFVVLEDGQAIEGPLDLSFDELLKDIASKYNKNKKNDIAVALIGLAKYHPDGSVIEIKKLQHIVVYQEGIPEFFPSLKKQLRSLFELKNGWLDDSGKGFNQLELNLVQQWLEDLLKSGELPSPFIYPADNSVIECEWSFGFWEISFSFAPAINAVVFHAAHVDSQEVREDRLALNDKESIEKAKRFLKTALSRI